MVLVGTSGASTGNQSHPPIKLRGELVPRDLLYRSISQPSSIVYVLYVVIRSHLPSYLKKMANNVLPTIVETASNEIEEPEEWETAEDRQVLVRYRGAAKPNHTKACGVARRR